VQSLTSFLVALVLFLCVSLLRRELDRRRVNPALQKRATGT